MPVKPDRVAVAAFNVKLPVTASVPVPESVPFSTGVTPTMVGLLPRGRLQLALIVLLPVELIVTLLKVTPVHVTDEVPPSSVTVPPLALNVPPVTLNPCTVIVPLGAVIVPEPIEKVPLMSTVVYALKSTVAPLIV